jgi:hypothetical protein
MEIEKRTSPLSKEQKAELLRRALAGEKAVALSKEYQVTATYVRLIKRMHHDPQRFRDAAQKKMTRTLVESELKKLDEVLSSTKPADHGFPPHPNRWNLEHGMRLAEKLFKKSPSKRQLLECVGPYIPKRSEFRFTRPEPPKQLTPEDIEPEFDSDPSYAAYCLSPIYHQIRQREYEIAVADYDARFADADARELAAEEQMKALNDSEFSPATKRTGKHAKSKGSPFTPPRKKRR